MAQLGAVPRDTAQEIKLNVTATEELEEAKRTARRIEKNAHRLVQDLTHLTEVLPGLGIRVTVSPRDPE